MSDICKKAREALRTAEEFLDELGEGNITSIYLIGSRASGTAGPSSDWDFLVVGEDLDDIEEEKIRLAEEGNPFPGLDIDISPLRRSEHIDIIFSNKGPREGQKAIKVYPDKCRR